MTFKVPGYRVNQLLGRGSHGEVWSARANGSGELVALKRIVTADPRIVTAARAEAAVLAALDHPSLIQLREFIAMDAAVILVMELANAGSLAGLLGRRDRLSPGEVASTLSPIAAALAHAHHEGVLHGDVSAANVLFSEAGHPKLADFGVARMVGGDAEVIGTPAYLDPVIAAGGVPGAASDVFSMGAVALHCLTGTGPWHSGGATGIDGILAVAARGSIPDLAARLEHCAPDLAAVVIRALDPEPYRRGTAAEFALDLRASTRPVPVMLTGGRVVPRVGRHSLEGRQASMLAGRRAGSAAGTRQAAGARSGAGAPAAGRAATDGPRGVDPLTAGAVGRPVFSRPPRITAGPPQAELTHVSRPQVRPPVVAPRHGPRWLPAVLASRAWWLGFGAVVIGGSVLLAVAVALIALPRRAASISAVRPPSGTPDPRSAATVEGSAASAPATASAPAAATTASARAGAATAPVPRAPVAAPAEAARILAALDAIRSQAFELRRPDLLNGVYGVPGLLEQDTQQLTELVPPGCGVTGLRTRYRVLSASRSPTATSADALHVSVTASLGAGSVVCGGSVHGRTRAAGPVRLRLVIEGGRAGYRIVSERADAPAR